jgi:hypothetical protein
MRNTTYFPVKIIIALIFSISNLSAQAPEAFYGVQTHFGQWRRGDMNYDNMLAMLDSVRSAGIRVIRDECYWSDIETEKGVYNFPAEIDNYITKASEYGIKVLLILNYNNQLYQVNDSTSAVQTESNRLAYAEYCRQAVSRYSPLGVKYYEIWNEPNIPIFWSPEPDAADYAELLKVAYPAIKEANPDAIVLGGATSPAEGNDHPFIDWLTYFNGIKDNGGLDYMDAVSFHLYRFDGGPEYWLSTDIQNIRGIVGNNRDLYVTELGYPTSQIWPNVDLQEQAKYFSRLLLLARDYQQIKMITYYDLKNDGEDENENEHNFGLLNFDLSAKPAFEAYKTVTMLTGDKALISKNFSPGNYSLKFESDAETTYAMWKYSGDSEHTQQVNSNRLKVTSMTGEVSYFYDSDKSVQFNEELGIDDTPTYVTELDGFPAINDFHIYPYIDTMLVGDSFPLDFKAVTTNGSIVNVDSPSSLDWDFSTNAAIVDTSGIITAVNEGMGTLSVQFDGNLYYKDVTVIRDYTYNVIESFSTDNGFSTEFIGQTENASALQNNINYTTAPSSLEINYEYQFSALANHRLDFFCDYPLIGKPDSVLIDIYNNGSGHAFAFTFNKADGGQLKINPTIIDAGEGWQTVRFYIPYVNEDQYPLRLTSYSLYTVTPGAQAGQTYSGTVLIDNLRIHSGTVTAIHVSDEPLPSVFSLEQNFPNPFNPSTVIQYSIPAVKTGHAPSLHEVTLKVYDVLGREVAVLVNEHQSPGDYKVEWDATGLASGVYLYSINVETTIGSAGFTRVKKMVLLR